MRNARGRLRLVRRQWADRLRSRYVAGDRDVEINPLLSPLRYDIIVRLQHFQFLAANAELLDNDFERYVEKATSEPYYVWFKDVFVKRFRPDLERTQKRLDSAFRGQLRKTAALWTSYHKNGLDPRRPVTLKAGHEILPTPTGKRLTQPYFAGDGCHRIALVLYSGREVLAPSEYRVRWYDRLVPVDNTHRLLRVLALDPQTYFSFLSLRFEVKDARSASFRDKETFLDYVRREHPKEFDEMSEVVRIDGEAFLPAA
jgi:hypothetical protein